jgi:cytochrome P450 family 628
VKQVDLNRRGLFSYLIEGSHVSGKKTLSGSEEDLIYDSELAIVAGSDTSAATTSAILFLLAQHSHTLQYLREEIDAAIDRHRKLSHDAVRGLPYLEGCINEGLRLYPAVMSGVPRETGPGGAIIAGRHIPPFTIVSTPTYTLHRGQSCFPDLNTIDI